MGNCFNCHGIIINYLDPSKAVNKKDVEVEKLSYNAIYEDIQELNKTNLDEEVKII